MAQKRSMVGLAELNERICRIENRLFGNGDSLIERIATMESQQKQLAVEIAEFREEQKTRVMLNTNELLQKLNEKYDCQLEEMRRNNKLALYGVLITMLGLAASVLATAMGWI